MALFSLRSLEGYMEVDHRESPGFTADQAVATGWRRIASQVGKGQRAQVPTAICGHTRAGFLCEAMVILNPMRTRDRGFCPKCQSYLCDQCELERRLSGGECKAKARLIDEHMDKAAKGLIV